MDLDRCAPPKPARGSHTLEKEAREAKAHAHEIKVKAEAKRRDSWTCRWPEKHVCRKGLEAAHLVDASLGGAMDTFNLISLCGWIHRRGPQSVHGKQLKVEPRDARRGADGPCSFWKQDEAGQFYMVAQERAIGIVERD